MTFKAIWKDGPIEDWNSENNQWRRKKTYLDGPNFPVVLKCLHNSQNITADFLNEVSYLFPIIKSFINCLKKMCYIFFILQ